MHQVQDKDLAFFTTLLIQVSVSIGISLTSGKHLHDCIISLRGEVRHDCIISLRGEVRDDCIISLRGEVRHDCIISLRGEVILEL
jgi:hypothetical protein